MIFLDTTVLVGAADRRDDHHEDGKATFASVAAGEQGKAFVTDFVLDETFTILRGRRGVGPRGAAAFGRTVLMSTRVRCIYIDEATFGEALREFPRYGETLSFTDVSTVVAMRREGCDTLFSHDRDFDRVQGIVRLARPG